MLIEVARPCCSYRRSCGATYITVYDIDNGEVVKEISAWRCWRARLEGGPNHLIIILEFDPQKHLVFYRYRTNSNNGKIIFYNIPPSLTLEQAIELIRKKWEYKDVFAYIAEPTADGYDYTYSPYYYKPLI